jgi:hypothetical protein
MRPNYPRRHEADVVRGGGDPPRTPALGGVVVVHLPDGRSGPQVHSAACALSPATFGPTYSCVPTNELVLQTLTQPQTVEETPRAGDDASVASTAEAGRLVFLFGFAGEDVNPRGWLSTPCQPTGPAGRAEQGASSQPAGSRVAR